jgi:hypothetical protein
VPCTLRRAKIGRRILMAAKKGLKKGAAKKGAAKKTAKKGAKKKK